MTHSSTDHRLRALNGWLADLGHPNATLKSVSSDASLRRYFRFAQGALSLVAVDTPLPEAENRAFIDIGTALRRADLQVPEVYEHDLLNGFMLLQDFGDRTFAKAIEQDPIKPYQDACELLIRMQNSASLRDASQSMPRYDKTKVIFELDIFRQWCLSEHLKLSLNASDERDWNETAQRLIECFERQPQGFVHRDFHCRNIMVLGDQSLGLLDFQGAVHGPLCYDWASLLKDCYYNLPSDLRTQLLRTLCERTAPAILRQYNSQTLEKFFDLTGLQRHLKAIGIFCRLLHQDQKAAYMADVPRTFNYVIQATRTHPELAPLQRIIERHQLEERLC